MTDDQSFPDPPVDLSADLREALEAHAEDPHELRETIIYAQELLNALHEPAATIEPNEGEEIVRLREHSGYTEVVKRFHGESDAYLYHVRNEPRPSGEEHLHWTLIARVDPDDLE